MAFLSILPVGMDSDGVNQTARYMALFPIVGALLGFMVAVGVWLIELVLPALIAGTIGVGLILLLTGVHHTDGLLDFGDGIMCHGSRRRKLRVMADPQTGAGGLCLGFVVLATTAFAVAALNRTLLIQGIVAAEASAKFSMVLEASLGKSARKGLNTAFIQEMRGRWPRLFVSSAILLATLIFLIRALSISVFLGAVAVTAIMLWISSRHFGGITGDVFGATNDLTRVVCLLIVVGAAFWV